MKRKAIYIIMVSLLAAAAVSCTREIQAPDGEEATLTVTASLDAAMDGGTKASADDGLTNLAGQGYQLRYMMELWSPDGTTKEYKATPKYIDITDNMSMSVEYNLNLLAKKYKMVLWADIVKENNDGTVTAYYTVPETDGLKAIVFPVESAFGSDEYDAFTAVADVDLTDGSKVIGATLKRPFAKIRVIDDRIYTDPKVKTKLYFSPEIEIPQTYDALNRTVKTYSKLSYSPEYISATETNIGLCLFTGYIFVPETGADQPSTKYSFTIVVNGEEKVQVSYVTVRRNALTTVKGKIL